MSNKPPSFGDLGKSARDIFDKGFGKFDEISAMFKATLNARYCSCCMNTWCVLESMIVCSQLLRIVAAIVCWNVN